MISEEDWNGWRSVVLERDGVRLVAPLEFGPRVLFFGAANGGNLFHVFDNEEGSGPGGDYYFRGGHRLWHAPEHPVRTYQPDNDALTFEKNSDDAFAVRAPVEPATGMKKELAISAVGGGTFRITHRLENRGLWAVETAAWGLTVFRPGGIVAIPLPKKGEHPRDLLPEYSLIPWSYTDFSLPAWRFHERFLSLDVRCTDRPQKVGATPACTDWTAYWRDGSLFVKRVVEAPGERYPDRGSSIEVFSNGEMAELETLGPMISLDAGTVITHVEEWIVMNDIPEPADDTVWRKSVLPAVDAWREQRQAEGSR